MDYTIIACKGDDGKPLAGTFEAVKRDDRRIGARGWWGGRSMMGLLGQYALTVAPARDGEPEGLDNAVQIVGQRQVALEIIASADWIRGDPLCEQSAHAGVGDQTLVERVLGDH